METSHLFPITSRPAPVRPVPARPGWARPTPQAHLPAGGDAPAPTPPAATVGVEFTRRRDGVEMVTFIDLKTGVVISRTPPEQVLRVVDSIIEAIQRRERADGDR
jgi:hypothetical protein